MKITKDTVATFKKQVEKEREFLEAALIRLQGAETMINAVEAELDREVLEDKKPDLPKLKEILKDADLVPVKKEQANAK